MGFKFPTELPVAKYPDTLGGNISKELAQGFGELLGTILFLFCGFGALNSAATLEANSGMTNLTVAFGFGIGLLVNCWTFFRFTGGVFNPAITCALFLANPRRFGIRRWFIYTIMQLVGGILAALLADVAFPTDTAVTVNFPDNGTSAKQAVVLELIGTYLLTSVVLMGAVEKSRATFMAPLAIGLTLFVVVLILNPFTTGAVNPAKAFGSAVVANFWSKQWVYWVGPYSGAILAVVFHAGLRMLNYQVLNGSVDDFDFTAQGGVSDEPEADDFTPLVEESAEPEMVEDDVEKGSLPAQRNEREKMRKKGGESAVNLLDDSHDE